MSILNRRQTVQTTAAALAMALTHSNQSDAADEPLRELPLCVFTKPFNSLSFDQLAEKVAELGFQGIEAPVRPGGHVLPIEVPTRLPKLVSALKKQGLEISVLTSNINSVSDRVSRQTLEVAAELGIKQFRMQYFKYDKSAPVFEQLDKWSKAIAELAAFCSKLGIQAVYQNHAGVNYMGAALWDLQHVLREIDPAHVGVAYDIRHATVEGGTSWPLTFRMIAPHVVTVYVKDFVWKEARVENVPLGQGQIDSAFFKMLSDTEFQGPISLHEEYIDHKDPALVPQHLGAIKQDLGVLSSWLGK